MPSSGLTRQQISSLKRLGWQPSRYRAARPDPVDDAIVLEADEEAEHLHVPLKNAAHTMPKDLMQDKEHR